MQTLLRKTRTRIAPYDLPNKSTALGQTVPSLAIGAATGGSGSLATMILVSAATQATLAGGETYITTNDRTESVKAAAIAGVNGAIAPVTAKLPLPATTGKLQGLDDNKIFESIVTQSALSGGFRAANAVKYIKNNRAEVLSVFDQALKSSVGNNLNLTLAEQGRPLTAKEGGAVYRTAGKTADEIKYLQTVKTRRGIELKEISAESYTATKGAVREVEISNRQFEAARGVRLTAEGKIATTDDWRLAKNLDPAQGTVKQEPRFVTPTTAEFFRQVEIVKGIREVQNIRQDLQIGKGRNIGFANISVDGKQWRVVGHSGEFSSKNTVSIPEKRFFKIEVDGHNRAYDSEVKILEDFANKHSANAKTVKGKIYIFTERPPCNSCTKVFDQFREMFPNIKLEVGSGGYK